MTATRSSTLPAQPGCLARETVTLPPGAVVELDDRLVRVGPDGQFEEVLASGLPRPGCAHATARRPR